MTITLHSHVPSLVEIATNVIISNAHCAHCDCGTLDMVLYIAHSTGVALALNVNSILTSRWYAHLYAIQNKRHLVHVHPDTAVEYMATVHIHGGVVRYLRHALLWAYWLVERVGIIAGNDAILDGRAWERYYEFSFSCSWNRWRDVYYSIHFNMAVDHMWKTMIHDSIERDGWVPNIYFRPDRTQLTVKVDKAMCTTKR